jgi:hypothetical protein
VRGREGAKEGAEIAGGGRHVLGCPAIVWVLKVVLGLQKICKIKTTHLEMIKNHETF